MNVRQMSSSHPTLSLTHVRAGLSTKQALIALCEPSLIHADIPPHPSQVIPHQRASVYVLHYTALTMEHILHELLRIGKRMYYFFSWAA